MENKLRRRHVDGRELRGSRTANPEVTVISELYRSPRLPTAQPREYLHNGGHRIEGNSANQLLVDSRLLTIGHVPIGAALRMDLTTNEGVNRATRLFKAAGSCSIPPWAGYQKCN